MKKMFMVIALALCSLLSYAPTASVLYIPTVNPIVKMVKGYESLIAAIYYHESGFNPSAYNPKENAVGGLQIRQCRINHYNELTGKKYTLEEMYDFNKAKEVFLYFADGKSYEQAAKDWNGSGPMTELYWDSINYILKKGFIRLPKQFSRRELVAEKHLEIERPIIRESVAKVHVNNIQLKVNV